MPPSSPNLYRIFKSIAAACSIAARLSFVGLIITSPLALHWTVVSRPVSNIFSSYTDFSIYASDVFLLLTLACWGASVLFSGAPLRRGPWFLTWPIVGLVALSWIGVVTGLDHVLTLYNSIRFSLLLALYFFLLNEDLKPIWVASALTIAVVTQALVAVAQFQIQHSIGLGALGELALNPIDAGASILRIGDFRILRAYGLTEHPNLLGGFFAFALIFLLGFYIAQFKRPRLRFLTLIPLAVGGLGIFVTFSRAAVVAYLAGALLLTLIIVWLPQTRIRRLTEVVLAAIVILAVAAVPILTNRRLIAQRIGLDNSFVENSNEQRSLAERDALLASADRIFYKNELFGVGNGALPLAMYESDDLFQKQFYFQPAHFVLLDAAAELGMFGGMIWLWLLAAPFAALWIRRRGFIADPWLATTLAAIVVVTIIGFYDYYPWLGIPGRLWQWSAWGLFGATFQSMRNI